MSYTFNLLIMGDVMLFNATFNNISFISWRSVLLVEETVVPGEKTGASHLQDLWHNVVSSIPRRERSPDWYENFNQHV
jgi:hypothetical protein